MARKRKGKGDALENFSRTLAVVTDHLERCENYLKHTKHASIVDGEAIKAVKELGGLANQMMKTQQALHTKGMEQVAGMSLSEQFDVAVRWICSLPIGYRQKAGEAINETLKRKGEA